MELVEYFIVNKDLIEKYDMSPGKIAAQVGHVAEDIALAKQDDAIFQLWRAGDRKKVVLKAKEKELIKLIEKGAFFVRDLGYTEIPRNSLTVVGFPPADKAEMQNLIKRLRLY